MVRARVTLKARVRFRERGMIRGRATTMDMLEL
jgi:hypothetical protein